jgi:nitrile hydratase beta subunit
MDRALHDMGGNERFFGPIDREADEPVFHEPWEARTFGLVMAVGGILGANFDATRDAIERLDEETYLRGYYVRWLHALERQLEARRFMAEGELDARLRGQAPPGKATRKPPRWQKAMRTRLMRKAMAPMPAWLLRLYPRAQGFARKAQSAPVFQPGDSVRVLSERPSGHTRIPGYLCGRRGTVQRGHGAMVFPDVHAEGREEDPRHLYTVRFEGEEVWGGGAEPGIVLLVDLFEPYLEAA